MVSAVLVVGFVVWLGAGVVLAVVYLVLAVHWAGYHELGDLAVLELKLEMFEHEVLVHVVCQTETAGGLAGTEQASHQWTEVFAVLQLTEEWFDECLTGKFAW